MVTPRRETYLYQAGALEDHLYCPNEQTKGGHHMSKLANTKTAITIANGELRAVPLACTAGTLSGSGLRADLGADVA